MSNNSCNLGSFSKCWRKGRHTGIVFVAYVFCDNTFHSSSLSHPFSVQPFYNSHDTSASKHSHLHRELTQKQLYNIGQWNKIALKQTEMFIYFSYWIVLYCMMFVLLCCSVESDWETHGLSAVIIVQIPKQLNTHRMIPHWSHTCWSNIVV